MTIKTLTVDKNKVYEEVAKTTHYTGKKTEEGQSFERISTTEQDYEMLERFWSESKDTACNSMMKKLLSETEADGRYAITLELSGSFDEALADSMERSLFSFFVMNITAKWYTLANKEEAAGYAQEAATYMDDVKRKAYYKKKPVRPTYNNTKPSNA